MKIAITKDTMSQIYLDAVKIRQKVFVEEQQVPPELEIDQYEAACVHFVLYDEENQAQATARLLPNKDKNQATLQRMAVYKEARDKGYGRMVVLAVEEFAKKQGFAKIELHGQLTAQNFYEKLGYTPYGEIFDDAGIDHISMEKALV